MPGSHACFTFFICCSCICRDLKISLILFAMHFWLLMAWVVFRSAILYDLLLLGIRPRLFIGLPFPGSFCVHSMALLAFSYCTTLLFLLTCCLTQSCWASLGLLFISLPVTQCIHWAFSYTICRLLCPISFWASLAHLISLGFHDAFPILLSRGPSLTLLGFPGPITLYFILGANGFSISPLLSLLILLWACCGPFSLFYRLLIGFTSYLFPGPFRPVCFFMTHFMSP